MEVLKMPGKMDRKLIEKRCAYVGCGLLFETKNSRSKYCSEECRKQAKRLAQQNLRSLVLKKHIPRTADKSIGEIMR